MEESDNPFATVVMAHLDTLETRRNQNERKDRKFNLIRGLLQRGWNENQVRQLFRLIDWMMDLPKPLENDFWNELKQFKEKNQMPFVTTPERYGREEGLKEGLNKGLNQGIVRGIEVALKVKFGSSSLAFMPEIRSIEDSDKLEAILQSIETAASLDDVRRVWTA